MTMFQVAQSLVVLLTLTIFFHHPEQLSCLAADPSPQSPVCVIPPGQFDGMVTLTSILMPWYGNRCENGFNLYQVILNQCMPKYCCSAMDQPCACSNVNIQLQNQCAGNATMIKCFIPWTIQNTTIYKCCDGFVEVDHTCIAKKCLTCSDQCLLDSTGTYNCACRNSSQILVNGTTCVDMCSANPGLCTDVCTSVTTSPGFNCSCISDRALGDDGRTCYNVPIQRIVVPLPPSPVQTNPPPYPNPQQGSSTTTLLPTSAPSTDNLFTMKFAIIVAMIILGCILFALCCLCIFCLACWRKRREQKEKPVVFVEAEVGSDEKKKAIPLDDGFVKIDLSHEPSKVFLNDDDFKRNMFDIDEFFHNEKVIDTYKGGKDDFIGQGEKNPKRRVENVYAGLPPNSPTSPLSPGFNSPMLTSRGSVSDPADHERKDNATNGKYSGEDEDLENGGYASLDELKLDTKI